MRRRLGLATLLVASSVLVATSPATPASADGDPLIALAGDIACDPASDSFRGGAGTDSACQMRLTSDLLTDDDVRLVLALGDTQYEDGRASAYAASYDPTWGRVLHKTRAIIGNHEYRTDDGSPFRDYFGDRAPQRNSIMAIDGASIGAPTWRLYGLDTNCERADVQCSAGSRQDDALKADLAAHPELCVLAIGHHPRWSSGSHGSTPAIAPLLETLQEAHAEVYVAGHEHDYERFWKMHEDGDRDKQYGLRTFVAGLGGKESKAFQETAHGSVARVTGTSGVLMMRLKKDTYDYAFVEAGTGRALDAGSGTCRR